MFSGLANLFFGHTTANIDPEPKSDNSIKGIDNNKDLELSSGINYEIDEDDWFIIDSEPEVEEDDSLPRSGSEDELPFVQIRRPSSATYHNSINNNRQRSQAHHLRLGLGSTSVATVTNTALSPLRDGGYNSGVTQSLYAVSQLSDTSNNIFNSPASISMEESWFLTPPPCFTSTGPINLESSPFENLLIEHPSMSVYRSIRSAQEATESFVNLNLGVVEESQNGRRPQVLERVTITLTDSETAQQQRQPRSARMVFKQQIKQEVLFQNSRKTHQKKDRQNKCRGAMKRGNKVRDFNGKGNNCQRRSDMQHCNTISKANNNRKC